MKVLILGGCGFIGSHIVKKLVEEGNEVCVFDRLNTSVQNIISVLDQVELIYGDFANEWDLRKAVKGCDVIYHLISTTFPGSTIQSGVYDANTNLIPTIKLLEIAIECKIKHIIYLSSGGTVYGDKAKTPISESSPAEPTTLYGLSKLSVENYIKMYCFKNGIKYTILRASNVYGPKQNIFGIQGIIAVSIGNLIRHKPQMIWGDGEIYRDYIFVDDLVEGLFSAMIKGGENRLYNIGSEKMYTINHILQLIERVSGRKMDLVYHKSQKVDIKMNMLAINKIKEDLNWQPVTEIQEGIEKTWDWAVKKYSKELA
jgi:UDP-glucose 4-epimerase